jgi:hypothetical protein
MSPSDLLRQNIKARYKRTVRESIEPSILNLLHKYKGLCVTGQNTDSYFYELNNIFHYYIDIYGMDKSVVNEVYDEIVNEFYNSHSFKESPFVEDSIKNCIDKFGYSH